MTDDSFSHISLPSLSQAQLERLEGPFSADKVCNAIKALKLNKRPGPDGFSALYFQTFSEPLSPVLANAFNSLLKGHSFRQETLTAIICMLPKPHTNKIIWTNYRPMSLLNLDIKLLAKILASRLNNFIGNLTHRDQVGFIPVCQVNDNINRAVRLSHAAKTCCISSCFLSLCIQHHILILYVLHPPEVGLRPPLPAMGPCAIQ